MVAVSPVPVSQQPLYQGLSKLYEKLRNNNPETEILKVQEDPFWKDGKIYSPVKRDLNKTLINWLSREVSS